jgi:hypothetical protein
VAIQRTPLSPSAMRKVFFSDTIGGRPGVEVLSDGDAASRDSGGQEGA